MGKSFTTRFHWLTLDNYIRTNNKQYSSNINYYININLS